MSHLKENCREEPARAEAASKSAEPKPVKFQKRFISIARLTFLSKVNDKDIAESLGVDVETLEWWMEEHPDPRNYGGRPSM